MSFRDNLQHLRATRNMTQEQLAMLLGVSRQSVSKWEAEKSYPEMDKLLKLCDLFDCSLDELIKGDLTTRDPEPELAIAPDSKPTDVCGPRVLWALRNPPKACGRALRGAQGIRPPALGGTRGTVPWTKGTVPRTQGTVPKIPDCSPVLGRFLWLPCHLPAMSTAGCNPKMQKEAASWWTGTHGNRRMCYKMRLDARRIS